ncbi:MAG: hypothetical protein EA400_14055 [Chromatiaceae bacterium]|nr:MAG: hypothetical protein EA400_14055 [Chromatiaceae bacterium]
MRFFNTEGPNWPDDHDTRPPLGRWDMETVQELIDQKKYFDRCMPRGTDPLLGVSQGQPWLINALAFTLCFESRARRNRNRARPIDAPRIDAARERLILEQVTHLD